MNRRSQNNRFTPRASDRQGNNSRKWLVWALVILVILLLIELIRPTLHHTANPKPTADIQKNAPTFEFYKVLPKVSLKEAKLDNLPTTTQALPSPQKTNTKAISNATYTLQFASLKDVDQAGALAAKINRAKGLGTHTAQVAMINKGKSVWYVVKIGPFKTRQAAENIQSILDRYYFSGRIFVNKA